MVKNKKGDRRERQLVNLIYATPDWAVIRAPASGSSTDRELPDVLAGNGDSFHAHEAKSSSGDPVYVRGDEIEALNRFADKFGADPKIAIRFDYRDWWFFDQEVMHKTGGGNYRVKLEDVDENAAARDPSKDIEMDDVVRPADHFTELIGEPVEDDDEEDSENDGDDDTTGGTGGE